MSRGGRMFHLVKRTWNPITGCKHRCVYCYAKRLAEGRLKSTRKYRQGFKPAIHEHEFKKKFKPGELIFVSDMGDMWGWWVPDEWILRVLEHVKKFPDTKFLFLTKYPKRYTEFDDMLIEMENVILGATIETDKTIDYLVWKISEAPAPDARLAPMWWLHYHGFENLMVSIEPVLDFNLDAFTEAIAKINPSFVYIGYDNYGNKLPEPPLSKTMRLVEALKKKGIKVYTKTMRKAWWEEQVDKQFQVTVK